MSKAKVFILLFVFPARFVGFLKWFSRAILALEYDGL